MILSKLCIRALVCSGLQAEEESYKLHLHLEHWRTRTTNCTMRFNTLFFLLGLSCLCLALAQVSYDDCCLKYVRKINHSIQKHAVKYRLQETDGGCNIPAVIFTMRRGRVFCTDPRESWVIELMKKLDKKRNKAPKKNYRAQVNRG